MLFARPRIWKIDIECVEAVSRYDVANDERRLGFNYPNVLRPCLMESSKRPHYGIRCTIDPKNVPIGMIFRESLDESAAADPNLGDERGVTSEQRFRRRGKLN